MSEDAWWFLIILAVVSFFSVCVLSAAGNSNDAHKRQQQIANLCINSGGDWTLVGTSRVCLNGNK